MTTLDSLEKLRQPDPNVLPEDMEQILEYVTNKPIRHYDLLRTLEEHGLIGHRFDNAFSRLRETGRIKVSENHTVTKNPEKPIELSDLGRQFLDAFYAANKTQTTTDKVKALQQRFIREDIFITGVEGDVLAELQALEYYILMEWGFPD